MPRKIFEIHYPRQVFPWRQIPSGKVPQRWCSLTATVTDELSGTECQGKSTFSDGRLTGTNLWRFVPSGKLSRVGFLGNHQENFSWRFQPVRRSSGSPRRLLPSGIPGNFPVGCLPSRKVPHRTSLTASLGTFTIVCICRKKLIWPLKLVTISSFHQSNSCEWRNNEQHGGIALYCIMMAF